jgi:hypothetical protein
MSDEHAPRMLSRPADAPAQLPRVRDDSVVASFRDEWRAQQERTDVRLPLRTRARRWAGRVSGRSDRRLLFALAGATDALASHCERLESRLNGQEAITQELADAYGADLARLRAEVVHLRELVASLQQTRE